MGSKSTDALHARQAWEKYWHKKVPKGFMVHHRNGDPTDNRPSNLMIVSRAKSNRIHKEGKTLAEQKYAAKNKPNIGTEDGKQRRFRK